MKKILFAVMLVLSVMQARAQLVINELMQSNIDCIMDELNDFPDSWVELYNSGNGAVNLSQYKLGDADDASKAWTLPNKMLAAKQYIIIYCDKVGSDASNGQHTDFRLDSGKGCEVYLFQGSTVADHVLIEKKQPAPNIGYGRKTDGSSEWGYQLTPTPGAANSGQICDVKHIVGEPVFSQKGFVGSSGESLTLTISLPSGAPSGSVIRYTRDGSEPTLTNGILYQSPFLINKDVTIRAKVFCDGYLSPRSTTHSYLFFPTNRPLTLPVISIVTNDRYWNDPQIGIYYKNPSKADDDHTQNYFQDWRRPINIEYFEGQHTGSLLNQLCETRIQGGATRTNPLKSLAIYANKRFGTKRFEYEFFPDQRPGVTDFKSLVLRNAGNDFDYLYMRDAIIQRTMASHVDLDWQAWRPAIVYINGVYRGMLNIRERSNEDNIYTHYDGLEDIDMFENWSELKEGTWDNYDAFKNFYAEHGHTLNEYAQWMDWEEFFNLMIMNLYFDNEDFPGNNIVMWRPRTSNGKWRWIAKDTDFGLGLYDTDPYYNTIAWVNQAGYDNNHNSWANQWEHTRLFRRMMEDPDLKREFIDRCAVYMGDFLNEKGTRAVWDPMYELIKTEYPYHRNLINAWWPSYDNELSKARNWLSKRTDYFYQHLKIYYELGNIRPMTINQSLTANELASMTFTFNGVKLSQGVFNGKFYQGRQVTLKGIPNANKVVVKWKIRQVSTSGALTEEEVEGDTYTFNMPMCSQLFINAVLGDATGIQTPVVSEPGDVWYSLDGQRLAGKPTRQGVYICDGKKIVVK